MKKINLEKIRSCYSNSFEKNIHFVGEMVASYDELHESQALDELAGKINEIIDVLNEKKHEHKFFLTKLSESRPYTGYLICEKCGEVKEIIRE